MIREFKISPLALMGAVSFLVVGELACGTSVYFVSMMALTMLCIGVIYNLLGGFSTLSGIAFSFLALRTIVISQFAKVFFLERADSNIESPELTISIYAVFYLCALLGLYVLGKIRLQLPRPLEPGTGSNARLIYLISVSVGLFATLAFQSFSRGSVEQTQFNTARSLALAFSQLLLFALVIAVDLRIRTTDGQHSFGVGALIPWLGATLVSFVQTSRQGIIAPTLIYFASCYLRGYHFKRKHFITVAIAIPTFFFLIAPLMLFNRGFENLGSIGQQVYFAFYTVYSHPDPAEWRAATEQASSEVEDRERYFSRPGTSILSRLSLIRADSNLINACSQGLHYGFEAIEIDLLGAIPTALYKDKPRYTNGADYVGRITGVSGDNPGVTFPALSMIGDTYGAFGWLGVVLVPLLCIPGLFIIYESMFEISRPWGTVALGTFVLSFSEMTLGGVLPLAVRSSITLVLFSYLVRAVTAVIPTQADRQEIFQRAADADI